MAALWGSRQPLAALNELGGLAELEERDGGFVIRGYSCPLTSVVRDHPEPADPRALRARREFSSLLFRGRESPSCRGRVEETVGG